jgi:hypothetical protein
MAEVRIGSIEPPLLQTGLVTTLALTLVGRAQAMGLLPFREEETAVLDRALLDELARELRRHGVASVASASLARAARVEPIDEPELVAALHATIQALDASPHPEGEWAPARELLEDALLADLLAISVSSLRRYAGGERRTPDAVAWRLHVVARLLAALIGSYNDYGVRRWFQRPRKTLGGATPADVLARAQSEDDPQLRQTVELADELTGPAAAY